MGDLKVRLLINDFDFLAPLARGDAAPDGIDLVYERDTRAALDRTLADESIGAGELSFARHIGRLARGDRSFVGIPIFPHRAFRHRCFFVRGGGGLRALADLAGTRIGTNEWPATGNTWSRAALREAGVAIESISWWVGSVDGAPPSRPQGSLPPNVRQSTATTLQEMLLAGELDALMCPKPPSRFYETDMPIVRLIPDYRRAEQEYFKRTRVYPAHHIVGMRRELFERAPWAASSLYRALASSIEQWAARERPLAETTPWMLAELEEVEALMGAAWRSCGVAPNRHMIGVLCDELFAQGLTERLVEADEVFQEFGLSS